MNNEKRRKNKEGITRVKLLSNLKKKLFLNKIFPIPYQGFKKDHMFPNIIWAKGITKNQTDQMKSERGLTNGSLEPVKPKTIKIIKRKKLIKLIKILIEFKSIEEIKLKRLKKNIS